MASAPDRRWGVAAAAVAVGLAAVTLHALTVQEKIPDDTTSAPIVSTSPELATWAHDFGVWRGQYRHRTVQMWWLAAPGDGWLGLIFREKWIVDAWLPGTLAKPWVMASTRTGNRDWVVGSEHAAAELGVQLLPAGSVDMRRRHVGWLADDRAEAMRPAYNAEMVPSPMAGGCCATDRFARSWTILPLDLPAELPTDSHDVYGVPRAGTAPGQEHPARVDADIGVLMHVADLLYTRPLPAEAQRNLFSALGVLPALRFVPDTTARDGRPAHALMGQRGGIKHELLLSTETDEFIGERQTTVRRFGRIPPGTVILESLVENGAVNAPPER